MAGIGGLDVTDAANRRGGAHSTAPATADGELAKLESQLSDWVHCASAKTSAGKAKIADISDKISAIKVQVRKADEAAKSTSRQAQITPTTASKGLRFDGLGTHVDVTA